jgi:hypothetical protein
MSEKMVYFKQNSPAPTTTAMESTKVEADPPAATTPPETTTVKEETIPKDDSDSKAFVKRTAQTPTEGALTFVNSLLSNLPKKEPTEQEQKHQERMQKLDFYAGCVGIGLVGTCAVFVLMLGIYYLRMAAVSKLVALKTA